VDQSVSVNGIKETRNAGELKEVLRKGTLGWRSAHLRASSKSGKEARKKLRGLMRERPENGSALLECVAID